MADNIHVVRQVDVAGLVASAGVPTGRSADARPALEVAATQASWFASGHSGCVFARLAALKDHGWHFIVSDPLDSNAADQVAATVRSLQRDPTCEVVSLVLPSIRTEVDALEAIAKLCEADLLFVEQAVLDGDKRSAYVRLPIDDEVVAWVMAFGPFVNMPPTRRSPYFELAMRVRSKSGELFHRLNQDPTVAHLADLPMAMPERHWEHRWASTLKRTRRILGGEPNAFSAARCTFTTSVENWNTVGIEAFARSIIDNDSQFANYGSSESA